MSAWCWLGLTSPLFVMPSPIPCRHCDPIPEARVLVCAHVPMRMSTSPRVRAPAASCPIGLTSKSIAVLRTKLSEMW